MLNSEINYERCEKVGFEKDEKDLTGNLAKGRLCQFLMSLPPNKLRLNLADKSN